MRVAAVADCKRRQSTCKFEVDDRVCFSYSSAHEMQDIRAFRRFREEERMVNSQRSAMARLLRITIVASSASCVAPLVAAAAEKAAAVGANRADP